MAVVVVQEDRAKLEAFLHQAEITSGRKRGQKWMKSTHRQRLKFIEIAFATHLPNLEIFVEKHSTTDFIGHTLDTVRRTIEVSIRGIVPEPYLATITIDGLKKAEERPVTTTLRRRGLSIRQVRGQRDEAEVFLRLADFIVGLVRSAHDGRSEIYQEIVKHLRQRKIITMLL